MSERTELLALSEIREVLGCGMKPMAMDLPKMIATIKSERDKLLALEKQYAERLGQLAQLCDIVCPWVTCQHYTGRDTVPDDVVEAASQIMGYVDAIRP